VRQISQLISLAVIGILLLNACKNDLEEINSFDQREHNPDVLAYNFETHYTTNAKLKIKLTAPVVQKFLNAEEPYSEFPKGVKLLFYDDNQKLKTSLVADYAIYFDNKEFGKAEGNVIIINEDSAILRSEQLFIDQKNEKIYSKKIVKITETSGYEITGRKGFESNLSFTVYKFWNTFGIIPFEGEIQEIESKPVDP